MALAREKPAFGQTIKLGETNLASNCESSKMPQLSKKRPGRPKNTAALSGGTDTLRPRGNSEVYLFRDRQRVINLNTEIPDRALNLGVAKQ